MHGAENIKFITMALFVKDGKHVVFMVKNLPN
jgi:hypothetical protein